jgi:hypothetical protein
MDKISTIPNITFMFMIMILMQVEVKKQKKKIEVFFSFCTHSKLIQ